MHSERRLAAAWLALLLTACAAPVEKPSSPIQQGRTQYASSQYDAALDSYSAALAGKALPLADAIEAHKHMAFIYCQTQREILCREQFQAILKLDPSFTLTADEEKQPQWSAVWSSLKGASEDNKAIARGSDVAASKSQEQLAEGMRIYKEGRYKEAAAMLEQARASGLPDVADQVRAHKYAAFSYCLAGQPAACQKSFAAIFRLDPAFALLPSEAGHPAWRNVFRKAQAAARPPKKR
jgi:tetratricopeptide (TPR) repeat protein